MRGGYWLKSSLGRGVEGGITHDNVPRDVSVPMLAFEFEKTKGRNRETYSTPFLKISHFCSAPSRQSVERL